MTTTPLFRSDPNQSKNAITSIQLTDYRPTPVPDGLWRELYGGALISTMVLLVLYGLSVLQTYLYYLNYPDDSRRLKMLVTILFCMSTLHAVFACHALYDYMILSYHDPLLLIGGDWSLYMGPGIGIIICCLVQSFYVRMIYLLTKHKWRCFLTIGLVLLILMQVAFGTLSVVGEFREWDIVKLSNIAHDAMVPTSAVRAAADLVTALSLCILLRRAQQVDLIGSAKLVHTLIIFSVNRFLLTTVAVLVQMIVLIYSPTTTWAMLIDFISAHLYVNSCLATLNSRNHMRNIGNGIEPSEFLNMTGIEFRNSQTGTIGRNTHLMDVELNNTRTTGGEGIGMAKSIKNHNPNDTVISAV